MSQEKNKGKKIKTGGGQTTRKNSASKSGSLKSSNSKSGRGKSGGKKAGGTKAGGNAAVKKRAENTNLRLIKNGDLPVKNQVAKALPIKKSRQKREADFYEDRHGAGEWLAQHKSLVIIGISIFIMAVLLSAVYYYIITTYTVTTVYVDGNIHYTNEEVIDMVMKGRYGNNSLYLAVKYKDEGVEGVPFVEKMDVSILSPDTIRINVYEKAFAGYVEYLGQYMYFDKDGIVVESSGVKTPGVSQVTGLSFGYVVLNEPLPVENDSIFKQILSITQLLAKYDLAADKIFFDSSYNLTLYFGGIKVTLGSGENMDGKIMKLQYILPELEGKSGTLPMENYSEDTKNITFNPD